MAELTRYMDVIQRPSQERFALGVHVLRRKVLGMNGSTFGGIIGMDQGNLSRLETGQSPVPPRDKVLDWCRSLAEHGAVEEDLDELMMSGGHLPELPDGFGTVADAEILKLALYERVGRRPRKGYIEMCQARIMILREGGPENIYLQYSTPVGPN